MHVSHVKVSGTGRAGNPGKENSHGKSFCRLFVSPCKGNLSIHQIEMTSHLCFKQGLKKILSGKLYEKIRVHKTNTIFWDQCSKM